MTGWGRGMAEQLNSHTVNNIKIEYNNLGFASDPLNQYCFIHT